MLKLLLSVIAAFLLMVSESYAHHSFSAEYDGTKPVKVTGVIKRVEWANPHIWFYVEGKDDVSGRMAVWGLRIIGYLCRWFFVKTGTWMLYGKRFTMN